MLTVSDEDGGSAVTSQTITVANVIPVITGLSVNSAVINENGSVTISGSFTDKGIQDTHTVLINWGNGETSSAAVVVQGSGSGTFSATHQYRDDNPTSTSFDPYTIRATVTDDDGGLSVSSTVGITVNNVIPAIAVLSNTSPEGGNAAEGQSITISGSFTDVGTLDTHKANINWGDGNVSTATLVQGAGSGTFAGSHAYTTGGIFTITVTLTDDDGGSVTSTTTAVITGIGVVGNTLYVIGTDKDDHVTINQAGSVYRVHADFLTTGNFRDVPIAGISRIVVQACGGNDQVTISGGISLPALIDGGKGDDKLNGGNGTNIIIGGDGNDDINGGNARDILIGGKGSDRLVGNGDEDILIAGWTDYDAFLPSTNYAPLWSLMAEWNRSTDQATRRSNITAGGGLNGTYRLSASAIPLAATVHDDNDQDKLTGSSGIDWFFANLSGGAFLDVITDKSVNELVEELT